MGGGGPEPLKTGPGDGISYLGKEAEEAELPPALLN